jgi:hypothetical protein
MLYLRNDAVVREASVRKSVKRPKFVISEGKEKQVRDV